MDVPLISCSAMRSKRFQCGLDQRFQISILLQSGRMMQVAQRGEKSAKEVWQDRMRGLNLSTEQIQILLTVRRYWPHSTLR